HRRKSAPKCRHKSSHVARRRCGSDAHGACGQSYRAPGALWTGLRRPERVERGVQMEGCNLYNFGSMDPPPTFITLGPSGTCHENALLKYLEFQGLIDDAVRILLVDDLLEGIEQA